MVLQLRTSLSHSLKRAETRTRQNTATRLRSTTHTFVSGENGKLENLFTLLPTPNHPSGINLLWRNTEWYCHDLSS